MLRLGPALALVGGLSLLAVTGAPVSAQVLAPEVSSQGQSVASTEVEGAAPTEGETAVPAGGDAAVPSGREAVAPVMGSDPLLPLEEGAREEGPGEEGPGEEGDADGVDGEAIGGGESATLPHDLSPLGMFLAADYVVKGVLLGLMLASVLTWTVGVTKAIEVIAGGRRSRRMARDLNRSETLGEALLLLQTSKAPEAVLVREAVVESHMSQSRAHQQSKGLVERVSSRLSRVEAALVRRMNRGTGILAIIGSTAPFIGLFGTVWGIMNAFIGISKSQTTNLAVVAPGIAEALLATAIGLVAAIPAVVLYNLFARAIGGYRAGLSDLGADVERKVGRDAELGRLTVGYADVAE